MDAAARCGLRPFFLRKEGSCGNDVHYAAEAWENSNHQYVFNVDKYNKLETKENEMYRE